MTNLTETERAYLAGYTDAEGCVGIVRHPRAWSAYVQFKQVSPVVVDWIATHYRGVLSYSGGTENCRIVKKIKINRIAEVRKFAFDVFPYLREKRDQVRILLEEFSLDGSPAANLDAKNRISALKKRAIDPSSFAVEKRLSIAAAAPNETCSEEGCDAPRHSRGYCSNHYAMALYYKKITTNKKGEGVPFEYGRAPTDVEKAYFAGYFDGDGCLSLFPHRRTAWVLAVAFGQTQPDALLVMHEIYGGALNLRVTNKNPNARPSLFYQLGQRSAVIAFLRDISAYVIEKRDQVMAVLERFRPDMSEEEGTALRESITQMKKVAISTAVLQGKA